MSAPFSILWLRRDLRLDDNPALAHILSCRTKPLFLYIHQPDEEAPWSEGAASRWWRHQSLLSLKHSLQQRGSDLIIRAGDSATVLNELCRQVGIHQVVANALYEPATLARDLDRQRHLADIGIELKLKHSALLNSPWIPRKGDDTPYKVFTPYWRQLQRTGWHRPTASAPASLPPPPPVASIPIESLGLLPAIDWYHGMAQRWNPGEAGAWQQLQRFEDEVADRYIDGRERPGTDLTSLLSPHLHFGEISVARVAERIEQNMAAGQLSSTQGEAFLRQLAWRDFAHHLLYHFPHTTDSPLNASFQHFPWRRDYREDLERWQRGETGVPIIDAGMRELWQTGWMHNRVRMVVASFLTKNLLIPWQEGARWFWDTLVDADLANNTMGWQWVAGSGADAAPYFRIFNPVRQGERYDPTGRYVSHYLPALQDLPPKQIHQPWLHGPFPEPMVDLAASRQRALNAYQHVRSQ